eukprot:CAMPEP_0113517652 /NCGR_PEP_ID=MMETSP0014_2-20120614/42391_1 /TAXON_ID=2857 /ORGANISM="Nitzschia sp." /LENGTH=114 /DNA_ID=CAMNT_0000414899 /DNA_START=146 /DNA_END=487 /DNA_ORIENTATION=- /assembly_acc=CAM_ASM_000159
MTDVTILVVPNPGSQITTIATQDERTGSIFIDLQHFSGRLQILEGNFRSNSDRLGDNLQEETGKRTQLQPLALPTKNTVKNFNKDDDDDDDDGDDVKNVDNGAIEVTMSSVVED